MKAIMAIILCAFFASICAQELVDLRSSEFKMNNIGEDNSQKARDILNETIRAHGWDKVGSNDTLIIHYQDIWSEKGKALNPWPKDYHSLIQKFKIADFNNSTIVLKGGAKDGYVYGIDDGCTFEGASLDSIEIKPNPYMKFFLTTYEYFYKMPYMTKYIPIKYYLGETTVNGVTYQKVFGSWTHEPSIEYDQYIFWINKKTKFLEFVSYTIRELGGTNMGNMFFSEFKSFGKLIVPTIQKVVKKPGDTDDLHTLKLIDLKIK